jgi:hypothetical protein
MSDPRRFHNFWWCIGDTAGWFVDRDRAKFGRIATPDDLPPLIFEDDSEARERRPDTRLLREFEKGLVAYDPRTGPIAPETWLFKSEGDIKAAFLRGVCCKRDDVLARCPELPAPVSRPEDNEADYGIIAEPPAEQDDRATKMQRPAADQVVTDEPAACIDPEALDSVLAGESGRSAAPLPTVLLRLDGFPADLRNAQTMSGNELRQAPDREIHKATTPVCDQAGANAPRSLSKPDSKQVSLPKRRPGPTPGTVNRFGEADLNLRSEFETLIQGPPKMSRSAAALKLAQEGKLDGIGSSTAESRARRLMRRFQKGNAHH